MSTEDRIQSLHAAIALFLVYAICLASALVSCHCERTADTNPPTCQPANLPTRDP